MQTPRCPADGEVDMIRSFNLTRPTVPNLVVAQRVLDKMMIAAQHYVQDETGEAMIGLVVPGSHTNGVDTIYVLDTISPDESAVRQLHTFQQGDERQDEIIWWLQENWHVYREKRRGSFGNALQAKWDVPLRYLGDWHKQPGFMIAPSGGDQRTALDWLDDPSNNMEFLLAPIVTLGHPSTTLTGNTNANFLTIPMPDAQHLRVDFWYIHRDLRLFQPIIPAVYPNEQLPRLTDYPWHLVNQSRINQEYALLQADELFTSIVLWNATPEPPLEICFMTARMGSDRVLLIITPWNYPDHAPTARVAPFIQMGPEDDMYEIFEEMWSNSEVVANPPDWHWSSEQYLVDYIRVLEESLGMKTSTEPLTVSESMADSDEEPCDEETNDLRTSPADLDTVAEED